MFRDIPQHDTHTKYYENQMMGDRHAW